MIEDGRVVKVWHSINRGHAVGFGFDWEDRERYIVGFADRRAGMFLMAGFLKLSGNAQLVGC